MDFFKKICEQENLYWAWKKAKSIYDYEEDFIINRYELVEFEANLSNNIKELSESLLSKTYKMRKMIPMSLPKNKAGDLPQPRQNFKINFIDQIVWIAIINILGPVLDNKMPFWSFGSRLYTPMWKDDEDKPYKFGKYSPSSSKIYRTWSSSWPLFRKSIYITVKKMSNSSNDLIDEDQEYLDSFSKAPDCIKIKYWDNNYWSKNTEKEVYHAQLDLKKFYPSIKKHVINDNILNNITPYFSVENDFENLSWLIDTMLSFQINSISINSCVDKFERKGFRDENNPVEYDALPTGLFVAGFLSNVAMMHIDFKINEYINKTKTIAIMRYVDDHVFLAYTMEELVAFVNHYQDLLKKAFSTEIINNDKTQPEAFKSLLQTKESDENYKQIFHIAKSKCKLDPNLPTPFLTLTLKKISDLSKENTNFLDEDEKLSFINELEHILATEFPNEEIKKETRVSWAASKLTTLTATINFDVVDLNYSYDKLTLKQNEIEKLNEKRLKYENKEFNTKSIIEEIIKLENECVNLQQEFTKIERTIEGNEKKLYQRVFLLLKKALLENICKPKIWKKLIIFCRTSGYDGLDNLLELLKTSNLLTLEAKEYLFCTFISCLEYNLLLAIKIKSNSFSKNHEINKSDIFIQKVCSSEFLSKLKKQSENYKMYYVEPILSEFENIVSIAKYEANIDFTVVCSMQNLSKKEVLDFFANVWLFSSVLYKTSDFMPLKILDTLYKIDYNKFDFSDTQLCLYAKLISMHPDMLTENHYKKFDGLPTSPLHKVPFHSIKDNSEQHEICLFDWILSLNEYWNSFEGNHNFDTRLSEWALLKIFLLILKSLENISSLSQINESSKIISIENFYIKIPEDFRTFFADKEPQTWKLVLEAFGKINIEYIEKIAIEDYRYKEYIYTTKLDISKSEIFSLGVLLINLLSKDFDFHPLINRKDSMDKTYNIILTKLQDTYTSSYTRAIIQGCLTYKTFELTYLSEFDQIIKNRDSNYKNLPLKINTINDLKTHIEKSINVLERLQIQVDDDSSFQLVPLSFQNLNRTSNPFDKEGE